MHLCVEFTKKADHWSGAWAFEGIMPNLRPNEMSDGLKGRGRNWRQSLDCAHFYSYADKDGAVRDSSGVRHMWSNYHPSFVPVGIRRAYCMPRALPLKSPYCVQPKWIDKLGETRVDACRAGSAAGPDGSSR